MLVRLFRRFGLPKHASRLQYRRNANAAFPIPKTVEKPNDVKNPLQNLIRDTIKATGPMSFSSYMQLCLSHPEHGYYMDPQNSIFGKQGDFITSPEISQIFGELVAIWHLSRWMAAGSPPEIRVVEVGPGRGTLMSDALRTWFQFPACRSAIKSIHLVETSPHLRKAQLEKLQTASINETESCELLHWHESVEDIPNPTPNSFTMVIAHEFFDALPVHIIERCDDGWHDVLVSFDRSSGSAANHPPLVLVRSPEASLSAKLLAASSPRFSARPIGSRLEVCPTSFKIARQIAELINFSEGNGGSGLVIDYGGNRSFGNSIRAFRDHKIVDVFDSPGRCDMTANVDFAYLREAMDGAGASTWMATKIWPLQSRPQSRDKDCRIPLDTEPFFKFWLDKVVQNAFLNNFIEPEFFFFVRVEELFDDSHASTYGPISQKDFLLNMGFHVRLSRLLSAAKEETRVREIRQAAQRLIDPTGMGREYQVLGVTGTGRPGAKENGEGVWPFVQK